MAQSSLGIPLDPARLEKLAQLREINPFCYGFLHYHLARGTPKSELSHQIAKSASLDDSLAGVWDQAFEKLGVGLAEPIKPPTPPVPTPTPTPKPAPQVASPKLPVAKAPAVNPWNESVQKIVKPTLAQHYPGMPIGENEQQKVYNWHQQWNQQRQSPDYTASQRLLTTPAQQLNPQELAQKQQFEQMIGQHRQAYEKDLGIHPEARTNPGRSAAPYLYGDYTHMMPVAQRDAKGTITGVSYVPTEAGQKLQLQQALNYGAVNDQNFGYGTSRLKSDRTSFANMPSLPSSPEEAANWYARHQGLTKAPEEYNKAREQYLANAQKEVYDLANKGTLPGLPKQTPYVSSEDYYRRNSPEALAAAKQQKEEAINKEIARRMGQFSYKDPSRGLELGSGMFPRNVAESPIESANSDMALMAPTGGIGAGIKGVRALFRGGKGLVGGLAGRAGAAAAEEAAPTIAKGVGTVAEEAAPLAAKGLNTAAEGLAPAAVPTPGLISRMLNWAKAPYQAEPLIPSAETFAGGSIRPVGLARQTGYGLSRLGTHGIDYGIGQLGQAVGAPNAAVAGLKALTTTPLRLLSGEGALSHLLRGNLGRAAAYGAGTASIPAIAAKLRDPDKDVQLNESASKWLLPAETLKMLDDWGIMKPEQVGISADAAANLRKSPIRNPVQGITSRANDLGQIIGHGTAAVGDPALRSRFFNAAGSAIRGLFDKPSEKLDQASNLGNQDPNSSLAFEDKLKRQLETAQANIADAERFLQDPNYGVADGRRAITERKLQQDKELINNINQYQAAKNQPNPNFVRSGAVPVVPQVPSNSYTGQPVTDQLSGGLAGGGMGLGITGISGAQAPGVGGPNTPTVPVSAEGTPEQPAPATTPQTPQYADGLAKTIQSLKNAQPGTPEHQQLQQAQSLHYDLTHADATAKAKMYEALGTTNPTTEQMKGYYEKPEVKQEVASRLYKDPVFQKEFPNLDPEKAMGVSLSIWQRMNDTHKMLFYGGLTLSALGLLTSMFSGGGDDDEEGHHGGGMSMWGPLLGLGGLGLAGYGATGGQPSKLLSGNFWKGIPASVGL